MPLTSQTIQLGIVIDPLEELNVKKDSTIAMIEAAHKKQWDIYVIYQKNLFIINGEAYATMRQLTYQPGESPWYRLSEARDMPLSDLSCILMRKDPPFDMNYIHTTYVLDLAVNKGVFVANHPQALRDANEKVFTSWFPQCTPPTIFSMDKEKLKAFIDEHQAVVIKPLDRMGGKSVFIIKAGDPNLNVILETVTKDFQELITIQKYIPEISKGDKRVLIIDGEPVPYGLARIPTKDDPRGNLAAGGRGELFKLSESEYRICEVVAPALKAKGLFFVGLDIIGDYITEINVTSPTCIREIEQGASIKIADKLIDKIGERIKFT